MIVEPPAELLEEGEDLVPTELHCSPGTTR
jgi:hypothetical protein